MKHAELMKGEGNGALHWHGVNRHIPKVVGEGGQANLQGDRQRKDNPPTLGKTERADCRGEREGSRGTSAERARSGRTPGSADQSPADKGGVATPTRRDV